MSADQLLADLKAVGLTVVEEPGWKTRGAVRSNGSPSPWATNNKPEGVMQHHTAPPNPFPIKRLYDLGAEQNNDPGDVGQIKCNMATWPDGTLFLVSYGRCNYSSGPGSKVVLEENVRPKIPPTANAITRGLVDTPKWGGNRTYWNYENSHNGDGSPLPSVQLETIVVSNIVVNAYFGLTWQQTISHAEHSRRKIDPRWNGGNRTAIEQIRELVGEGEDVSIGPEGEPNWDEVSSWAQNAWTWAWANSLITKDSHPKAQQTIEQQMVFLNRYDNRGPHPI